MIRVSKGTFRHIEGELYAYPDTKKEIERIRQEILAPYDEEINDPGVVKGKNSVRMPGDPTGRTATALATDRRTEHLKKAIAAIDGVYARLTPDKQELIRLRYWTRPQLLTWDGIAEKLHVSRRQAINWRDGIVFAISLEMGWK